MSIAINGLLLGITLLLGLIPLLLTARLKRRLPELAQQNAIGGDCPPATAILPCKGLDPGFRENVLSLMAQDYPDLELLFVVAAADDPAYDALRTLLDELLAEHPRFRTNLLVAGINLNRAQKLTNQLAAIRQVSPTSRVLVFVDSDCRPDPGFIRRLVAPLNDPAVGATTGYRWYHPPEPTLGSLLRSTWNAGALPFLIDPKRVFAWGGAMAIRRDIFERAGIAKAWDRSVSDDMTLTVAVRDLSLEVRFVPQCIAVSYETSTLAETLEFTNRQSVISRIYFPPLWWGTALGHSSANLLLAYGFFSLAMWARGGDAGFLLGSACLLLLPLQLANAAWLFNSARDLLPAEVQVQLDKLRWHYVFTAPLASLMTLINTVHAATTRRITWRGIGYILRSPVETVVLPPKE
jgi:ceramide glucosyltransferase